MRKAKYILVVSIFIAIGLIVYAAFIKTRVPNNIFCYLDIGTYRIPPEMVEVNSSNTYGQTFVSNFNDLFMMSIFIPKQDLNRNGDLYFHLKKNINDDKDLATLHWKFNQIHFLENSFYIIPPDRESTNKGFHFHFKFPPVKNSKNEEFYFYFESPNTKPREGIKLGIWNKISYYEALTKGNMFINHKPIEGFLAFRTYNTWEGKIADVFNKIYLRFCMDIPFALLYGCLIFVTLMGILFIRRNNN